MFSILGERVEGSEVLDLYAGSGALGIEALSRGARHAVFVDSRSMCVRTILENIKKCGFEDRATVIRGTVPRCIPKMVSRYNGTYGIVFLDPPYRMVFYTSILEALEQASLLKRGAVIIIEHARRQEVRDIPTSFRLLRTRLYGTVGTTFLLFET